VRAKKNKETEKVLQAHFLTALFQFAESNAWNEKGNPLNFYTSFLKAFMKNIFYRCF
jgi:hypothetical protein